MGGSENRLCVAACGPILFIVTAKEAAKEAAEAAAANVTFVGNEPRW